MTAAYDALTRAEKDGLEAISAPATGSWRAMRRPYQLALGGGDAAAAVIAALVAIWASGGVDMIYGVSIGPAWFGGLIAAWLGLLWFGRTYEDRYIGTGSEEFRRVVNAGVRLLALVAVLVFSAKAPVSRGFIGLAIPLTCALTLAWRATLRAWLHRQRRAGRGIHRVVVVGRRLAAERLCRGFAEQQSVGAGLEVVGVCTDGDRGFVIGGRHLPVVGELDSIVTAVVEHGADTVAVASDSGLTPTQLRHLAWQLEGTPVDLLIGTDLVEVAGPRIHIRPVSGMPLLHVEEPELRGARRLLKATYDRALAGLGLIVLSPLLLLMALAVKIDSAGPVLYRQIRVGQHGKEFSLLKFRSMREDAEGELQALLDSNEHDRDGLLFKIRADPRVTEVGRWMRAWSLDELPQLANVLRGQMSLVGPRPPLPTEVSRYKAEVRRRLLVKPGLTGLWQVSGRADLTWEQGVRMDLSYVENWSPALDLMILLKTVKAVTTRHGAY